MKFDHAVKYNGRWYEPFEEIEEEADFSASSDFDMSKYMDKPTDKKAYTKTEINRMPLDELKKLAFECEIDDAKKGAELKDSLIKHFGL